MRMNTSFIGKILETSKSDSETPKKQVEEHAKSELQIPENMPLTNRLDKMTREQAIWVLQNGDAWVEYLAQRALLE